MGPETGEGGGAQCNLAEHSRESYDLNLAAARGGGGISSVNTIVKAFGSQKESKSLKLRCPIFGTSGQVLAHKKYSDYKGCAKISGILHTRDGLSILCVSNATLLVRGFFPN